MKGLSGDDLILIERCQSGDPYAIDELLSRYRQAAFMYALRMTRHVEEAYDIVSEGFIRIHRAIDRFQATSSFSTWMYRILKNCFLDARKKKRIEAVMSLDQTVELGESSVFVQPVDESPSPFELCAESEFSTNVRGLLDKMNPSERALLLLYHENEHTYEEIAKMLGRPAGTIKSRLHRARSNFHKLLQNDSSLLEGLSL